MTYVAAARQNWLGLILVGIALGAVAAFAEPILFVPAPVVGVLFVAGALLFVVRLLTKEGH